MPQSDTEIFRVLQHELSTTLCGFPEMFFIFQFILKTFDSYSVADIL